jgi:hypothetical protein
VLNAHREEETVTFRVTDLMIEGSALAAKRKPKKPAKKDCGSCTNCSFCTGCTICTGCSFCTRTAATGCGTASAFPCQSTESSRHEENLAMLREELLTCLARQDVAA